MILRRDKQLDQAQVLSLYQANQWSSAKHPEALMAALANSHAVVTAWEGDRLVGLGNVITDGHLVAYYPHLLVHPDRQGQGIGRKIIEELQTEFQGFHQQILVSEAPAIPFYEKCGFKKAEDTQSMWIYLGEDH
ncbi:MAG: GNAT family N-acetyltransferase [Bacteroidota bacterium]